MRSVARRNSYSPTADGGITLALSPVEDRLSRSLSQDPELMPTMELIELSDQLDRRLRECQAELDRRASGGLEAMPGRS